MTAGAAERPFTPSVGAALLARHAAPQNAATRGVLALFTLARQRAGLLRLAALDFKDVVECGTCSLRMIVPILSQREGLHVLRIWSACGLCSQNSA